MPSVLKGEMTMDEDGDGLSKANHHHHHDFVDDQRKLLQEEHHFGHFDWPIESLLGICRNFCN